MSAITLFHFFRFHYSSHHSSTKIRAKNRLYSQEMISMILHCLFIQEHHIISSSGNYWK